MDDLIKRQDAIDALGERPPTWALSEYEMGLQNQYDSDLEAIQDVPSVQQWTPCSEGLPKRKSSEQLRGWYLTTNAYGSVGITKYEFESGSFGFIGWGSDIRIVAWSPLPEPYKEENNEVVN